ncbi:MAG: SIS domain-containing protein [Phycisphaerales bacterium]|nr:SIS domain-containing protein [Phycisphaerales bacterium]
MSTQRIRSRIDSSLDALARLGSQIDLIHAMREQLAAMFAAGGTLYTCGNGGSAAQAMHLSEELIGRYDADRGPYRAVCLNADPSALTCITNDMGWDQVFARQVQALVTKHDALLVFSTSGNSPNIVKALDAATAAGALTIGLLGKTGGACADPARCQVPIVVDSHDTAHVQEAHLVLLHLLCDRFEP